MQTPLHALTPAVSLAAPTHNVLAAAANDAQAMTPVVAIALEDAIVVRKKRKFAHTNEAQRRCMLEWLEHPGNFQLLTKSKASGVILKGATGKKIKKTDGFRALTHHINVSTGSNWTMEITKSRYESFLTTYRKVKAQSQQPDFGLTENDRARGFTDISQKLNSLCVFYDHLDALFDPKSRPSATVNEQGDQATAAMMSPTLDEQTLQVFSAVDALASTVTAASVADQPQLQARTSVEAHTPPQPMPEPSSQQPDGSMAEAISMKQLEMERQRLDLLQEQLVIQKRELDLRERELRRQEEERKRIIEIAAKMIEAGKSAAEVKSVLDVILTSK